MTISIDANFITYNDGTKQQSANWRVLDTNTDSFASNYAIGTYMLINTQLFMVKTAPIPLDGWTGEKTAPAITGLSSWPSINLNVAGQPFQITTGTSSYFSQQAPTVYSGTWRSRGGGLTQAFVVRVA